MSIEITLWVVFAAAMITAIATGLGALPFLFVKNFRPFWLSIFNALAAGLMLAASHSLVGEGSREAPWLTLLGMALGLLLVVVSDKLIERRGTPNVSELSGASARKALLILGIMTIHSFAEGVGVGVSFGGDESLGLFISAAIAIHNIPEGLAISLVLIPRGMSVLKAAGWSIFTSLPQPLMAVPAFIFVTWFAPFLPIGLGLAAGAMMWMVFAELIPDAFKDASPNAAATTVALAFFAMYAFQHGIY
ncbi:MULTISPECIES: ZIP family metal transporter [unclassified Halomonas]|uniref:ZIP family metal transporter n=1 Tax=unclassified Halomonas TaxID=2609666 RepID=UPI0007F11B7F|nr:MULTISPECIES: ZIP family metal transporter [unclassified Halomonas]SBR51533.1 Zinc transporter ZupT [Halomonas sp. HL-93]SNY97393.1 Zinc transporter ZupT [Halomonas sp. hl-4]